MKPKKENKPEQKKQEIKGNIFVYEVYVKEHNINNFINKFYEMASANEGSKYYCCKYEIPSENKYFVRIGIMDMTKEHIAEWEETLTESREQLILYFRRMRPFPLTPTDEGYTMDLIKFLSTKVLSDIKTHFKEYASVYETHPERMRNELGQIIPENQRANMNNNDWLGLIHHVLNILDYSYEQESYLYSQMYNRIHYNSHVSKLKS